MNASFGAIYRGLRVLITGHTGFKGSWLSFWLRELGATVIGYSLEPPTEPNLFSLAGLQKNIDHIYGDILDDTKLRQVVLEKSPDLIFHLAAQSLVKESYHIPQKTFQVNSQGSVNILEAALACGCPVIMVTTDKVYENYGQIWGYREIDRLGGSDPYSASKSMAELAIDSYRKSFFLPKNIGVASVRSGNVIGGGDFSVNRLIPDAIKALFAKTPILVRNPTSVRPWIYVLEPLSGYLMLGQKLLQDPLNYSEAWNFAPLENQGVKCQEMIERAIDFWGEGDWIAAPSEKGETEMHFLKLNGEKTLVHLSWSPCYDWVRALEETVSWYQRFSQGEDAYRLCVEQIETYHTAAELQNKEWCITHKEPYEIH